MAQPGNPVPQTKTPKSPVRMPQRSEEVSGDERKGEGPIAAAKPAKKKQGVTPPSNRRRPPAV